MQASFLRSARAERVLSARYVHVASGQLSRTLQYTLIIIIDVIRFVAITLRVIFAAIPRLGDAPSAFDDSDRAMERS